MQSIKRNNAYGAFAFCLLIATASYAPSQNFRVLTDFENSNGAAPYFGPLVQGVDGNLYGLTTAGGVYDGYGTAFRTTRKGSLTSLYSFDGADGSMPSGLIQGRDGNLYGTAYSGGAYIYGGVFFKMTPTGTVTILYNFCVQQDCADGQGPTGPIVQNVDGNFYGTTVYGGHKGHGTVYRVTPSGEFTTLYSFCDDKGCPDGSYPNGLIQASDGNLYGAASEGGTMQGGVVFKITPSGTHRTVQNFPGSFMPSSLTQALDGNLYGTTTYGGRYQQCGNGCGTIFRITQNNVMTTLYEFCSQASCADGTYPSGVVLQATDGALYGTTSYGGDESCLPSHGCGIVFRFGQNGTLSAFHTFEQTDGNLPAGIFQATNGLFYGTTVEGGDLTCKLSYADGCGTVFGLSRHLGPFVAFVQAGGTVSATAEILGQGFQGTSGVSFNGIPANFEVRADTFLTATVPSGATTGYVTVTTPTGVLTSNVPFHVIP